MKRKNISALHSKTKEELIKELVTKQKELTKMVTEKGLTRIKNTRLMRILKDDMARIQTVLSNIKVKESKA